MLLALKHLAHTKKNGKIIQCMFKYLVCDFYFLQYIETIQHCVLNKHENTQKHLRHPVLLCLKCSHWWSLLYFSGCLLTNHMYGGGQGSNVRLRFGCLPFVLYYRAALRNVTCVAQLCWKFTFRGMRIGVTHSFQQHVLLESPGWGNRSVL